MPVLFLTTTLFVPGALWRIVHLGTPLQPALEQAAALSSHEPIRTWLKSAIAKVAEAADPKSALSRQEFVDDIAVTSMARLWDVGKSEPIKVGKASPTEGALPSALYFALRCSPAPSIASAAITYFLFHASRYHNNFEQAIIANANVGGDSAARGIVIGMLLGASENWHLPPSHRWMTGLNSMREADVLMSELTRDASELWRAWYRPSSGINVSVYERLLIFLLLVSPFVKRN
jgi:hypothetical protein